MKILLNDTGYIFNKSAKTITFVDYAQIELKNILLITNVTVNKVIYNFAKFGGQVSGNVLTLDYNTDVLSMNNTDKLQIWYYNAEASYPGNPTGSIQQDILFEIKKLNSLVPERYDKMDLSYSGDNLTQVIYKFNLVTVSTINLIYTGNNITSVEVIS